MKTVDGTTSEVAGRRTWIHANGGDQIFCKESNVSETAKCRGRLAGYCVGKGLDLGCGDDKIVPSAIGVDVRKLPSVDRVGRIDQLAWLGIAPASLDYLYSSHALEHMPNPTQVLREWLRYLKPGGRLVLYLPHYQWYTQPNPEHYFSPVPETVRQWVIEAGQAIGRPVAIVHECGDHGDDRYSFDLVAQVKES